MGIKFHCPNGHKLHVKAFLAGKKGVCPDCGVKIVIPETSEPKQKRKRGDKGAEQPMMGAAPLPGPAVANVAAVPVMTGVPVGAMPVVKPSVPSSFPLPGIGVPAMATANPVPSAFAAIPSVAAAPNYGGMPMQTGMPTATVAQVRSFPAPAMGAPTAATYQPAMPSPVGYAPAAPVAVSAPVPDPIAENPNAAWYVRPPSGGQYGPARGDVMRKWIGEGRVSSDSLVWREGWTDWLGANIVFPSLKSAGASVGTPPAAPVESAPAAPFLASTPATTTASSKKRSSSKRGTSATTAVAIVVMLALLAVGLLIALFFVLSQTQGKPKKQPTTTQRADAGCIERRCVL